MPPKPVVSLSQLMLKLHPANQHQPSNSQPEALELQQQPTEGSSSPGANLIELRAGQSSKLFPVHKELLIDRSPYFSTLLQIAPHPTADTLTFEDIDEPVFALFVRWIYATPLFGPTSSSTMQHHLSLYVVAARFRIERLKNDVLDAVRAYYRRENMTAPPHRLEYIYAATEGPNPMRRFLVASAAYRVLCEGLPRLSDPLRAVLAKGGDLPVDFADCLLRMRRDGWGDVRRGPDCAFHEHVLTERCKVKSGSGSGDASG